MNENYETKDPLSCSFCKEKFSEVVKLIPDCGNNICGRCYEYLKEDVDKRTNKYKCAACGKKHTLPPNGLLDNEGLMYAIIGIKKTEKPLHPNAKKLRDLMRKVEDKMKKMRKFDEKELIKSHCERIELEASEAIEKAINHLEEIERKMMKQISEYRERCIQNLSIKSKENEYTTTQELKELEKEVREFNAQFKEFFTRRDANEFEEDIAAALDKTEEYMSALEWMEARMRKEALNWEEMVFKVNSQFLQEWNHVGKILITQPKKMTVQETPSFTLTGHSDYVNQVLFLTGGRMASCSDDKTIKIWNVENGKGLFLLKGHTDWVYSIALLPNGHLASGSKDKTIKIWDLEHRKEIRSIQAHSKDVVSLRVLKSGNLASYSCDDTIKIWNLNSKENKPVSTMRGHGNTDSWVLKLLGILSNDYLVTFAPHRQNKEECMLRVWNPNEPNSTIKSVPTGFNYVTSLLVLSNDQVALGFFESGTIKIIDLNSKALSRTKKRAHDEWVYSFAQLSNGNLISAGRDASIWNIKVWNLFDLRLLQTINSGHSDWIRSLSISGVERFLVSGSWDNTIKLWPIRIE